MNKDKMIEFAKDQCEIFPENSEMGKYLRETLKMLQAEPCEDVVSRAELLKIYEDGFVELQKIKHLKDNIGANDRQLGVNWCINTLKELPPVKPTQNWIPVNEKLPSIKNQTNKYLVTLKDKTVCDAMFTEHNGEHWWTYNDVVAWMPLPKSYNKRLG